MLTLWDSMLSFETTRTMYIPEGISTVSIKALFPSIVKDALIISFAPADIKEISNFDLIKNTTSNFNVLFN